MQMLLIDVAFNRNYTNAVPLHFNRKIHKSYEVSVAEVAIFEVSLCCVAKLRTGLRYSQSYARILFQNIVSRYRTLFLFTIYVID